MTDPTPGDQTPATAELDAAVLHAAKVWRATRHGQVTGDVYHQACRALDDAVALLNGEQVAEPTQPPTEEEVAKSQALSERLRERSARLREQFNHP